MELLKKSNTAQIVAFVMFALLGLMEVPTLYDNLSATIEYGFLHFLVFLICFSRFFVPLVYEPIISAKHKNQSFLHDLLSLKEEEKGGQNASFTRSCGGAPTRLRAAFLCAMKQAAAVVKRCYRVVGSLLERCLLLEEKM